MTKAPKIRFAVLCDDVRREDNGKLLFIGVYGESVLTQTFPAALAFAMPIWFDLEETYEGPITSEVLLDGERITEAKGIARIEMGQPLLAVSPIPVQAPKEGMLTFRLRFGDAGDWQTALKVPLKPGLSANASQPPAAQPRLAVPST